MAIQGVGFLQSESWFGHNQRTNISLQRRKKGFIRSTPRRAVDFARLQISQMPQAVLWPWAFWFDYVSKKANGRERRKKILGGTVISSFTEWLSGLFSFEEAALNAPKAYTQSYSAATATLHFSPVSTRKEASPPASHPGLLSEAGMLQYSMRVSWRFGIRLNWRYSNVKCHLSLPRSSRQGCFNKPCKFFCSLVFNKASLWNGNSLYDAADF